MMTICTQMQSLKIERKTWEWSFVYSYRESCTIKASPGISDMMSKDTIAEGNPSWLYS